MFWLRFPREFNVLIRLFVSGVTWSVRASSGKLCCVTSPGKLSSALQSLNSLLRDVTALARSWTSSDGWLRGERPADRRALEGAVAKAGSVALSGSREFRDSRDVQERRARTLARRFKLSVFGHRPQAAGPIRASVRGGAPPARLLLQGTFM